MRKLIYFFSICFLLTSCNDGDIITLALDFDDTFSSCEESSEIVFFKTNDDPSESLSILLNANIDDFIELDSNNELANPTEDFTINGSTKTFNYRTYNTSLPSSYFCEAITPNIVINSDYESTTGTVTVNTVLTEDDNDGIPADIEDANDDEDDDPSTNPTDTDGDSIPDYLDDDDDGDNVPTEDENPNYSTSSGLDDAQDTDEDGTPDYLDTDDDGDGVLTRDEENESVDQDPTNDITDNTIGSDYLNEQISETVTATAYREHTIKQTFTITVTVYDFELTGLLSQDEYDFGTLSPDETNSRTLTPEFN